MLPSRPHALATTPVLVVADLQRSIAFYTKLGFVEPAMWGEPPCFAMMNRDELDLMLSLAEDPSHVRPNGPHGVWDLYIKVEDLDAELTALTDLAVPIDHPIQSTEYDMRELEVVDPDGYRICFGANMEIA